MDSTNNNRQDGPLQRLVGRYPFDVQVVLWEECYAFTRGHHDLQTFVVAAANEAGPDYVIGQPKHEWWRVVPAPPGDDFSGYNVKAKAGARGAFPVTCADVTPNAVLTGGALPPDQE